MYTHQLSRLLFGQGFFQKGPCIFFAFKCLCKVVRVCEREKLRERERRRKKKAERGKI